MSVVIVTLTPSVALPTTSTALERIFQNEATDFGVVSHFVLSPCALRRQLLPRDYISRSVRDGLRDPDARGG